jgi:hypothetical protein
MQSHTQNRYPTGQASLAAPSTIKVLSTDPQISQHPIHERSNFNKIETLLVSHINQRGSYEPYAEHPCELSSEQRYYSTPKIIGQCQFFGHLISLIIFLFFIKLTKTSRSEITPFEIEFYTREDSMQGRGETQNFQAIVNFIN